MYRRKKPVLETSFVEAERQIAALRRSCTKIYVTGDQVKTVMQCFLASPHRVEAIITLYGRMIDREEIWKPLYALRPLEQANAIWRLGPANVYQPKRCSMHWVLDCSLGAHEEVAKKLVTQATASGAVPSMYNLRLKGANRKLPLESCLGYNYRIPRRSVVRSDVPC